MKQYQLPLPILLSEHIWIQSVLERSLLRFPELKSFDAEELRRFVIFWDNIFVRWIGGFYHVFGIGVEHRPEDKEHPIHFYHLPPHFKCFSGYGDVKLPAPLSSLELKPERVKELIDTHGPVGVVKEYLVFRTGTS